ncbi:hypothetical protein [Bradyrhizobium genosp. P]|uniref:hypothetical protein n=1 Tax=Bradyrhizobium genosp. P TaxID=83641 RepID=UPI003CEF657B
MVRRHNIAAFGKQLPLALAPIPARETETFLAMFGAEIVFGPEIVFSVFEFFLPASIVFVDFRLRRPRPLK